MNKKLFLGIIAAAMLTACSQDEVLEVNNDTNAIRVAVDAGASSRALDSYCPHVLPTTFNLSAVHADGEYALATYFKDDEMQQVSGNEYAFAGSSRFWPDNALNFYAWYCAQDVTFELETAQTTEEADTVKAKFTNFKVAANVADQADLLYGTTLGAEKSNGATNIVLNHALSQITFKANVENENIRVAIHEVGLVNLLDEGTFIWPDTIDSYKDGTYVPATFSDVTYTETESDDSETTGGKNPSEIGYGTSISSISEPAIHGGWIIESTAKEDSTYPNVYTSYGKGETIYNVELDETVELAAATEEDEDATKVLTAAPSDHINGDWSNVMQVLPQYSLGSDYNSLLEELVNMKRAPKHRMIPALYNISDMVKIRRLTSCALPLNNQQVYIRLNCDITTTNADSDDTITLYASEKNSEKQYIYIPIAMFWEPGYRYVYTINFSKNGNGGLDDSEDGDPVLDTINVTADVVEYNESGSIVNDITTVSDSMLEELVNMIR